MPSNVITGHWREVVKIATCQQLEGTEPRTATESWLSGVSLTLKAATGLMKTMSSKRDGRRGGQQADTNGTKDNNKLTRLLASTCQVEAERQCARKWMVTWVGGGIVPVKGVRPRSRKSVTLISSPTQRRSHEPKAHCPPHGILAHCGGSGQ